MRHYLLGAAFLVAATCVIAAQEITIRIPFGEDGFDLVTFDKSRVTVEEVNHSMKFAEWGDYASSGVSLSGCDQAAGSRMSKALTRARKVSDELNQEVDHSPELLPVLNYLKSSSLFRLWMGEQYVAFAKNKTAPESAYQTDDAPACRLIVERIQNEPDTEKACELLADEWTECTLKFRSLQQGGYPKSQWKAFLDANGIRESVTSDDND